MAPAQRVTRWLVSVLLIAAVLGLTLFTASQVADRGETVSGLVVDAAGPVVDATVRIQGRTASTLTDDEGHFELSGLTAGAPVSVSAWKEDYYCAKADGILPPAADVTLTLRSVQTNDNPDYEWIPPVATGGEVSCASCKLGLTQVWLDNDAHAGSALNPRFLSMYNGTDLAGNQSPLTRFAVSRDYGRFPLRPDLTQPYFGPGYKLDFPNTAGNCAACHTPGAAVDAPYDTDPNTVTGADAYGVHCDFCHKIANVTLDTGAGLPYPNQPGVLSMDIRRPFASDPERYQLFFGTFDDDNVPMEDTKLPLLAESQFCAACHYGVFWDTVVYNSFGEWLDSPYSDPTSDVARTCQQCHMPAPTTYEGEVMTNVAPGMGGIERDPMAIHAHTSPGAMSVELLQNALSMEASASREGGEIHVNVAVTNDRTGHDVPTDSPLRHLILLVRATDADGKVLAQTGGPTVPEWGGVGDPSSGYYAGLPGTAYAKILEELWTEVAPTGAYWNMTRLVSDNRIGAFETEQSSYTFAAPLSGDVAVEVRLLFRRAYKTLMDQKGWDMPDILMQSANLSVPGAAQP